jgi:hypothetical protein
MDPSSIASAAIGASAGQFQQAVGVKMLAMAQQASDAVVKMIDTATQGSVSAGIGGNLDRTV